MADAADQIVTAVGCQVFEAEIDLDDDGEYEWVGWRAGRGG
ncbi:hypothetical protein [Rhodococcoides fascians]|nr:hypothetical protein [Rhodococcus fascians]